MVPPAMERSICFFHLWRKTTRVIEISSGSPWLPSKRLTFFFHPLFHEDNDKHGSHDEIKPLCIKVEQGAADGAQSTHIDAVGHTQKQESRKNGDGMGKGSDKGCPDCIFWCFHLLWIPFAVKILCEL